MCRITGRIFLLILAAYSSRCRLPKLLTLQAVYLSFYRMPSRLSVILPVGSLSLILDAGLPICRMRRLKKRGYYGGDYGLFLQSRDAYMQEAVVYALKDA